MIEGSPRLSVVEAFRHLPPEELAALERTLRILPVARGQALVREGDPADALYIVVSGRFKVTRNFIAEPIAEIGAGMPVGEIAFFAGGARTATVVAGRDSLVLELKRDEFDRLAAGNPGIWPAITSQMARRLAATTMAGSARPRPILPRTIAICRAGGASGQSDTIDAFVAAFRQSFPSALRVRFLDAAAAHTVLDSRVPLGSSEATQWFNTLEGDHDHVVYVADPELTEWSKKALRQADLVLCVGRKAPGVSSSPSLLEHFAAQLHRKATLRLILVQDGAPPYEGTRNWLDARPWVEMHHHVATASGKFGSDVSRSDLARVLRFVRGEALGLVACGGGAFSAAHIGVFDAFAKAGIVFDIVGGTSGGAAMTAGLARAVDTDEMERRTHDIFVHRKAMRRWTWPRYSLLDHGEFDRALAEHFTTIAIEDLGLPFFAVATNLTTNTAHCIHRGPLWHAVRASAAIPAMLPPMFTDDGEMLVDGAVAAPVPLATIMSLKAGPNIVIDFSTADAARQPAGARTLPARGEIIARMITGGSRRLPIAPAPHSVLMRAMTMNRLDYVRDLCPRDILLEPPIPAGIGHLDWHRHADLRRIGRDYTAARLERLEAEGHPIFSRP
jgi:NTE family protein